MKKIITLFASLLSGAFLSAQVTQAWVAAYNGNPSPDDYAVDCVIDVSGNSYVTGYFTDAVGNTDYVTIKYNSAGVQQWLVSYNGAMGGYDQATAIAIDASGNVYVTGRSQNSGFSTDYATVKYNNSGVQQWAATYNGTGNNNDWATDVTVDASGNVYVTGSAYMIAGGDNYVTVKYNSAGIQQWAAIYTGTGTNYDIPYAIAVDGSGNVYVTGSAYFTNVDYATVKYNSAGVQQWASVYNGTGNGTDEAKAIAVDGSGNVYVTGNSTSTSNMNYATIKYNTAGVQQWATTYNGSANYHDRATAIAVDATGSVYVTGFSYCPNTNYATIKYNSAGVQQWLAIYNGAGNNDDVANALVVDGTGNVYVTGYSYSGTSNDYATVKYNSAGVQQWASTYGGSANNNDNAKAIAVDASGNVFVTGEVKNSNLFDYGTIKYNSAGVQQWVSIYNGTGNSDDYGYAMTIDAMGNSYVTGRGNNDYATVKYNSAGVQQWSVTYNGPGFNSLEIANAITVDASGNVYVTGSSGPGMDYGYATIKYNSSGVQQWVAIYNGTGGYLDIAEAIVVDAGGNVFVTGTATNTNEDIVTIKYNSAGLQQWVATYDGPATGSDYGRAIAIDAAGDVYVTGFAVFTSNNDYVTIKYSSSGVQQWIASYNGSGNSFDIANAIVVNGSNVYVTGYSATSTIADYCTIKYDTSGAQQWMSFYNGPGNSYDEAKAIVVDELGNVNVTGTTQAVNGYYDYATVRYNSAGVQQWATTYSSAGNANDEAGAIAIDSTGNVYVTGKSTISGVLQYATIKYNSSGAQQWLELYNGTRNLGNEGYAIATNGNGNVWVTGYAYNLVTSVDAVTIKYAQPTPLSVSQSQTNLSCNAVCNGTATVAASNGAAPYFYAWLPSGGTGATASSLCLGSYTCTITDNVGALLTKTFLITEPTAITSTSMQTNVSCNGGNNGDAMVMASGGTGSLSYLWSSGGTAAMETGLAAGNYSVAITDANACSITSTFTITEPTPITFSQMQTNVSCNGGNNGDAMVMASGGTGSLSYLWSSGGTTAMETGLAAGNYSVAITDANSCISTATFTITEPTAVTYMPMQTNISCNGGNNGGAMVMASGGTGSLSYLWSSGGTAAMETGLIAGNYTCTITDANSCATTATFTIAEPAVLSASINAAVNSSTCGGTDGSIDINVAGGTTYYSFLWSNNATTEDLTGIPAGTYSCVITDANGCSATISATISDPAAPIVTLTLPIDTACGSFPGIINLTGESPAGGIFSGITVSGNTFDPFTAGMGMHYITYTFTDANGCSATTADSITVDACSGIETAATAEWNLFPNPTNGAISITTIAELKSDVIVEIYSVDGKLIRSENKSQSKNITIDMTTEPVGVYFIHILENDKTSMHRIVKM